jgi:hypothetical protein
VVALTFSNSFLCRRKRNDVVLMTAFLPQALVGEFSRLELLLVTNIVVIVVNRQMQLSTDKSNGTLSSMQLDEKCSSRQSHLLHWALCDYYLESVQLPPLFGCPTATRKRPRRAIHIEQDAVKKNVEYAISTLQDLIEIKLSRLIELSTRLALAKLLIRFTQDWEQADENLRKVVGVHTICCFE